MVSFVSGTVTKSQADYVINLELNRFKEYHPNGIIKQRIERTAVGN
jgi:hypothetical protein